MAQNDLMAVGQTHRSDQPQRPKDQPSPEPVLAAAGLLPGDGFAEKGAGNVGHHNHHQQLNSMGLPISITTASQPRLRCQRQQGGRNR